MLAKKSAEHMPAAFHSLMFLLTNMTTAPGQAMAAMVQLELPHINVLTKVDLLNEPSKVCPCRHLGSSHPPVAWQKVGPALCALACRQWHASSLMHIVAGCRLNCLPCAPYWQLFLLPGDLALQVLRLALLSRVLGCNPA